MAELGSRGIRSLAVARTVGSVDGPWQMVGLLTFLDPPRPDTKDTIDRSNQFGVAVKMITGDHLLIAKETARVLGMGTQIDDAQGLPMLEEGGKIPNDLMNYFAQIEKADGFAQVRRASCQQPPPICLPACLADQPSDPAACLPCFRCTPSTSS